VENSLGSVSLTRLLDGLDELKRSTGVDDQLRLEKILTLLGKRRFSDATSLIRFHEALLFLRAYPQSPRLLRLIETILLTFSAHVAFVISVCEDSEAFADPAVSGIVGNSLTARFSYPIARWLAVRHPNDVSIDFEDYEDGARLGQTLPRFIPLLEEESLVEANVSYEDWLRAARRMGSRALPWLIERFESLDLSDMGKAELYDSLKLYIHWKPRRRRTTRTGMKLKRREIFYHNKPHLGRKDVSLSIELNSPPLAIKKLSRRDGAKILDTIRDTSTIRYRELHGFTYGDPGNVIHAHAGRSLEFFINGVKPENRLPLRAYHSVFMVKNGVPIGYVEGLSLFERMEIGFNIYYTFRDGESAWIYARVLRLFRQLLGVTTFSVDPYQIGFENEEGIESGAFWFYRKLGFRPVKSIIEKLVRAEEKKIASRASYRTSLKRLRELSEGHMLFEVLPDKHRSWDGFQVHNLGLVVAKSMSQRFRGNSLRMRRATIDFAQNVLGTSVLQWSEEAQTSFSNFALVLSLIPKLSQWSLEEKRAIIDLIRAKAGGEESKYLLLLQRHHRLRDVVIKLGS
jgi:hypothetical protein